MPEKAHFCYLLRSLNPQYKNSTYIGYTVNPKRRIRQHNREVTMQKSSNPIDNQWSQKDASCYALGDDRCCFRIPLTERRTFVWMVLYSCFCFVVMPRATSYAKHRLSSIYLSYIGTEKEIYRENRDRTANGVSHAFVSSEDVSHAMVRYESLYADH